MTASFTCDLCNAQTPSAFYVSLRSMNPEAAQQPVLAGHMCQSCSQDMNERMVESAKRRQVPEDPESPDN